MNIVASNTNHLLRGNGGSSPVEYTAGPNINITNRVISGKYWDNEIAQAAADASAAAVNSAYDKTTAWVDSQDYLTAHQDVSNLPYVKNSSLDYTTDGQVSSISGSGLYAVSADNATNADHADNATHADSADNALTAQFAFSSNSSLNSELANVASTAMTANFLDGGWQYDQFGFITAYNNSSFSNNGGGGGGVYQGIAPISVDNNAMVISADSAALGVQSPLYFVEDSVSATIIGIDSAVIPSFQLTDDGRVSSINNSALYGAGGGTATAYVGGDNIGIVNDVISVTGSVPSADSASYAVSAESADKANSATNADSANFATESNHSLSSDSATYDNLGREITATYLTAHQALPDWGPDISAASSNAYNSATAWVDSQNYLTAVTGDNTPYSAGANIDITNHVVSGKDWNSDIIAAANSAFTAATALIPTALTGDYVQSTALNTGTNGGQTIISGISGTGFFAASANTAQYATYANGAGTASTAMTANALVASASAWMDVTDYSAGPNINIDHHIISGKNWTNDINAASSYAFNLATANATGKYIPYTNITTGYSGTTCYNVASGIRVTGQSGWVELYTQDKENENEAHLQVGQNYTGNKSFWAEIDGAASGFFQMNWNSAHITPNTHTSYNEDTTASMDIGNGWITYSAKEGPFWTINSAKVNNWDSVTNTVSTNSANWGGRNYISATNNEGTYTVVGQNIELGLHLDNLRSWSRYGIDGVYTVYGTGNNATADSAAEYSPYGMLLWSGSESAKLDYPAIKMLQALSGFYTGTISDYNNGYAGFVFNDMSFSYHYSEVMPSASGIGGTWVAKQLNNNNYEISFNMYGMAPWVTAQWEEKTNVLVAQHAFVRRVGIIEMWKEWDPNNSYRIDRVVSYPTGDEYVTFGDVQVYGAATGGDNNPWHLDAILEVEKTN